MFVLQLQLTLTFSCAQAFASEPSTFSAAANSRPPYGFSEAITA